MKSFHQLLIVLGAALTGFLLVPPEPLANAVAPGPHDYRSGLWVAGSCLFLWVWSLIALARGRKRKG